MRIRNTMLLSAAFILSACAIRPDGPLGIASAFDFFTYSCIRQYEEMHSIRSYDGSLGYAVEWSHLGADELERLSASARVAAASIPAPNYADTEHGLPAVALVCRRASDGKLLR